MALTKIEASNIASGAVASSGFNSVQTFTASGTWTKPADITKVVVEVQGAGGSGSAAGGGYANGGAAGGYAKKFVDVSSVTASVITIGTGGVAVSVTSHGNPGGDSTWVDTASGGSLTLTGAGGAAGLNASYAIAIGGTATNGDINIQGGDGYPNNGSYIQQGGGSFYGTGGSGGYTGQGVTGAARGYGAGGGGGTNLVSTAGGGGIIIVWEYK